MRLFQSAFLLSFIFVITASAQFNYRGNPIRLKNGKEFILTMPEEFEIIPAVEGLRRVRFFAKAPDGRIFVTDMHDLSDNQNGAVYILDGFDAKTGKFEKAIPYLTGLHNPNSVQFYTDNSGQAWVYLAETDKLTRRKFLLGETSPTDLKPQIVATFPAYGLSYKYGGWHLTRTIAFSPAGKLYISVGSSCNSCIEKRAEKQRATILEMNPDGSDQQIFVKGIRNAVGLKWIGNRLVSSVQGVDHLGVDRPNELFVEPKRGDYYGWPLCYLFEGKYYGDPQYFKKKNKPNDCSSVSAPYAWFPAHSSALGFEYFDGNSNRALRNTFLVSLHGSTDKEVGHGYRIVAINDSKKIVDFMTGFLKAGIIYGRPCDIMKLDANSFLFTDDYSGVVYYVRKRIFGVKAPDKVPIKPVVKGKAKGKN